MNKPRVLVIGDLMLDEWVYGDVERLSPEAPIPVFDVGNSTTSLGGAGNVLVNLKALDADPMIISGISENVTGHKIKKMVSEICGENVFYFNIPESFNKQRICGNNQQIVRIDTGRGEEISDIEVDEYLDRLSGRVDIVLVADYGKGSITDYCLMRLSDFCYSEKIKLLIDPYITEHYEQENFYCSMMKLNKGEAEAFTGMKIKSEDDISIVGQELLKKFDTNSIMITLGADGIAYMDKATYSKKPKRKIDNPLHVYDVCGAGDVVFAALGYIMTFENMNLKDIMEYATKAGKIAVSKKETSVITREELFSE
jgi:D-beta-D-heptose 7-phosphate kinase/D-beta-D-heptose 1-phosphate adenosyltransferase